MASDEKVANWGDRFFHWGPYALLGLATLISAISGDLLMTQDEKHAAWILVPAALALQLWWSRIGPGLPEYGAVGRVYYIVRLVLGFVLTWLNPFFAIYAVLGYFDADRLLSRRYMYIGMFATAVTMAGSQSGGLPFADSTQGPPSACSSRSTSRSPSSSATSGSRRPRTPGPRPPPSRSWSWPTPVSNRR
ncbi:hypothetical protein ACFQX6_45815 [Streptosporangium lutulentum]